MRAALTALLAVFWAASAADVPRRVDRIDSESQFDSLSAPAPGGARRLLFVVDHLHGGRVSFIDSNRYAGHMGFLNDELLTAKQGMAFHSLATDSPERAFTLGWVSRRRSGYFMEFWEDDHMEPAHAASVWRLVSGRFFRRPALLVPRGSATASLEGIPRRTRASPSGYDALNPGRAMGVLRVGPLGGVPADEAILVVDDPDLDDVPVSAGLLLRRPTSRASHIAILSQSIGIPCAVVPGWEPGRLEGRRVALEVRATGFTVDRTDEQPPKRVRGRGIRLPAVLAPAPLLDLAAMRGGDSVRYGAKAANLGEAGAAGIPGLFVPAGFGVPFHDYAEFIRANGLQELTRRAAGLEVADGALLAELRRRIEEGRLPDEVEARLRRKLTAEFSGTPLFVRSSTNSEDLPGFVGAGLYKTVPNVRTPEEVLKALREVWASLWSERAFEARRRFGIDHHTALPGALIQTAVDADTAGIMLTIDPKRPKRSGAVFIAAKRGIGIRVVGGHALPEQIVYDPSTGRAEVMTRSGDEVELRLAARGGIESVPIRKGAPVLELADVRELARLGLRIEEHFGGEPLEIDWAVSDRKVWILQARRVPAH